MLSDTSFPIDRPLALVHGLKATRDGGYLILGQAGGNELRLIKTYPSGEKEWERIVPGRRGSEQYPLLALEEDAGGYWVVGMAKELEFMPEAEAETAFRSKKPYEIKTISFIARFSAAGEMEWRLPLGLKESFQGSRFVCGVNTSGGIVLVGTKYAHYDGQPPRGGRGLVVHPWIIKLDTQGKLLWETMIADDDKGVFSSTYIDAKSCSGPFLSEDGSITFGLLVHWRPTYYKDGVRILFGPGTEDKSNVTYLIVRLDSHGNEQARRRLDHELLGRLIPSGSGFLVISNPSPAFRRGIRRTWLNRDLTVTRSQETRPEGFSLVLDGASLGKDGGIHLAGFRVTPPNERGLTAIGYLKAEGGLVNVRTFGFGLPSWDIRAYTGGTREDEAAMVLQSDATVRLLRLRYRH